MDSGDLELPPGPVVLMAIKDSITPTSQPQVLEDLAISGHSVDFEALCALVYKLWPPPAPKGQRNRGGRPYLDRVPVVCAILANCDFVYGTLASPTALMRRLNAEDPEYRRRCGFTDAVPSQNTVVNTHQRMLRNWKSFAQCFEALPDAPWLFGGIEVADLGEGKPVEERRVYRRDWPAYNDAQVNEAEDVLGLLCGIADLVNEIDRQKRPNGDRGRPRLPLGTMLFALIYKAFLGQSARRVCAQLKLAARAGYIPKYGKSYFELAVGETGEPWIPCFNSINGYYGLGWLTPVLLELVTLTATPVRSLERDFAVDATGCSTHAFVRWVDYRTETELKEHGWVKLHMMCGALTNVITRAVVTGSDVHDNVPFRELFIETARRFHVCKVTADMAYLSHGNYALARDWNVQFFAPFKSNTAPYVDDGSAWSAALLDFLEHWESFMGEYHQRSNAESTFSAVKRKFPSELRMEFFIGQVNETLCKVLAYNLSGVAREVRMRGVKAEFPSEANRLEQLITEIYR